MNIFVLHPMPDVAARMQCDKHVSKMTLETAQMLCTVINELGGTSPYKSAHVNHPCSVWARQTMGNFMWLGGPSFKSRKVTSHPLCMPDEYKTDDAVESYRRFYIGEKAGFAQWNKTTEAPSWWPKGGE